MATAQAGKTFGLCKEVTLAVLPRLHQEELLLELGRRNIPVRETSKKESLVSKLWFIMVKEYHQQGMVQTAMPNNTSTSTPSITTGTSSSSATEQRTMWATLSNDLQELMETVTPTNTVSVTQTNGSFTTSSATIGNTDAPLATSARSTDLTQTQPLTSVTIASPPHLPVSIFTQEVVVETSAEAGSAKTPVTSPRRSARLHIMETQEAEESSSASNLGEMVETYHQPSEENPVSKEGQGKGRRKLRAMAVTRSDTCDVDSNTVVIDLRDIRGLEGGPAAEEDEEEDEVSSDEDDVVPLDDDDSDWQPESPMEDRQQNSSSKRLEFSGKDSSSYATPFEGTATSPTDNQTPHMQQKTPPRETKVETQRCRPTPLELQTQRRGMSVERRRFCREVRSLISKHQVTSSSEKGFRRVVKEVFGSFPHIIKGDIEVEVRRVLRTKRYEVKRRRKGREAPQGPAD
ncbi:PREDICTED: uncharacterized protein LOC109467338 [Branchiostoma belcheri]|uniref:Uncharacterized protein LOC109467338 n=1 Tax=Branchiostoma belcheri TaxID=7741 RepID=A0A6P4YQ96_BRABE|nr:PREDICTED: uncharacterized protein LOC109467338 [Branchiostoma belcheri]